jgi:hypothetical protein
MVAAPVVAAAADDALETASDVGVGVGVGSGVGTASGVGAPPVVGSSTVPP